MSHPTPFAAASFAALLAFAATAHAEPPADEPLSPVFASLDEGFGLRSTDDAYRLRIGGLLTPRIGVRANDDVQTFADVSLARLNLTGHIADELFTYQFQLGFAKEPTLLDLEIDAHPSSWLTIRLGRYRTPFSREFMTGLPVIALPSRSFVSDRFRADRDIGVTLAATPFDGKLEVQVGAFDGSGTGRPFEDSRPMALARFVTSPLGPVPYDNTVLTFDAPFRFAIGGGAYTSQRRGRRLLSDPSTGLVEEVVSDTAQSRSAIGIDVALRIERVSMLAEAYLARSQARDEAPVERSSGGFAQATVGLWERHLDSTFRFNLYAPDFDHHGLSGLRRYEVGLNWYILGKPLRLQMRYAYGEQDGSFTEPIVASQLAHEVVAQLMLSL